MFRIGGGCGEIRFASYRQNIRVYCGVW